jgi:ABC-2 type transport system ATP-binding protein
MRRDFDLLAVVRMYFDQHGTIEFEIDAASYRRLPAALLGYLPEERGLHRDVPVLQTLEYFGALRGMQPAVARQRALDGLKKLHLDGRERERIEALSKGNQQKVQFLCCVLHQPRFAVLDEPFSGLDPVNQQLFVDEIRMMRDAGCTIVLSAHQMDLVETLADRLLLVDGGRSVLHGSLADIRKATHSGTRLQLGIDSTELTAEQAAERIRARRGVTSVEVLAADRIALLLDPTARLGDVLQTITTDVPVSAVHSDAESLREIFLRTVGRVEEAS